MVGSAAYEFFLEVFTYVMLWQLPWEQGDRCLIKQLFRLESLDQSQWRVQLILFITSEQSMVLLSNSNAYFQLAVAAAAVGVHLPCTILIGSLASSSKDDANEMLYFN